MKQRSKVRKARWIYFFSIFIFNSLNLQSSVLVSDSLRQAMENAPSEAEQLYVSVLIAEQLLPSNMDSASALLAAAAPLLEGKNQLYKAVYLNKLGVYYWYAGDFHRAISMFRKTLEVPTDEQLLSQFAEASNNAGALYRFIGKPDSAGIYLEKALKIDVARNNQSGMAKTLYDLGALYRQTNKYELALINAQRAMDIVLQGKDTLMIVHVYTVLGNIYVELDSIPLAVESHIKAMQYAEDAGIKEMVGVGHNNLCAIYCDLPSEFDKTAYHFDKGMNIARELSDYPLMVSLNNNMGNAWRARNDFNQAMLYYQKAKSLLEFSVEPIREAELFFNIGQTFKYLKANDSARIYLTKCLETAQKIKSLKHQSEAYLEIAVIDSLNGDFFSANEFYHKGIALRDSLWNNQHRSRIAELQIIYETQKNKLYIKDLEHRQNLNQIIFIMIILTLTFGFVALVVMTLYFRKKRLVAQQLLIIQKQENEKTQTDLKIKRKELTARIYTIVTYEDLIKRLEEEIHKMMEVSNHQNAETLNSVLRLLNNKEKTEETWKEFLKHFDELNNEFISRLILNFPGLSPMEVRICAMLRLNMSTKEIADLTRRAIRTVEFYRTDIRKKIGLHNNDNLTTYLSTL